METRKIISRVEALYSKGAASDDSRLSKRLIYNKLITVRSRLLTQKIKAHQVLSHWNYQTLDCIDLIEAPKGECPPNTNKCTILRSKKLIPKILTDLDNTLIKSVTSIDGSTVFYPTEWELFKNAEGNKYTKNLPQYFFRNGYLYITKMVSLEVVTMTALFGDPVEADNFNKKETDKDCLGLLDKEFPIDHDMIDMAVRLASEELILLFSQMAEDKINNASDDSSPVKMPRGSQNYISE